MTLSNGKIRRVFRVFVLALAATAFVCPAASAASKGRRGLNDKVLNRPYTDMRRWHLGFSVGMHAQDIRLTHNGFITPEGEEWRMEQADFQPGFNVSGLVDLRLNDYFSLRFSPGMYFGSRNITMRELASGEIERQSIKSTYVTLPLDLKYAAKRWRNMRPYVVGGVMGAFDVSKKRADYLRLTTADAYLTIGVGCDFYLPYFKLIPELKFCFGLTDVLQHDRPDLVDDPASLKFTQSLSKATSKMIVLSFYFE